MSIPTYQNYNGTPLIPTPPNFPIAPVDYSQQYQDQILNVLRLYVTQLNNFSQSLVTPDFGTTAQRPIVKLLTGQMYFDTTLNIPIWWSGVHWVNASGTTV